MGCRSSQPTAGSKGVGNSIAWDAEVVSPLLVQRKGSSLAWEEEGLERLPRTNKFVCLKGGGNNIAWHAEVASPLLAQRERGLQPNLGHKSY